MTDENTNPENVTNETVETQPVIKEGEKVKSTNLDKPELSITTPKWNDLLKELEIIANDLSPETIEKIKMYGLNKRELEKGKAEYDKTTSQITVNSRGAKFKRLDATNKALDKEICEAIKIDYKNAKDQEETEQSVETKEETTAETPVEKKEEQPVVIERRKRIGLFRLRR